ncbi:flagellar motor switch protein FliM [bacterium]|nr:flagellar motor switch protein FliM [bacterium]
MTSASKTTAGIPGQPQAIPYDLRNQDRITRGRLPALEMIHERFARMFRITLSVALRKPVAVTLCSTGLIKFGDFKTSLPVPSSLNLFQLKPLTGSAIMLLERALIYNLLDVFYGGSGEPECDAGNRDFTAVEQRLVKRVTVSALEDLQTAWEPVFPVQTAYLRTETNPLFAAIVPRSEVVVKVSFAVDLGVRPMALELCIPYTMIDPVRPLLEAGFITDLAGANRFEKRIARNLRECRLKLVAKVSGKPLLVRTLIKLKEGDILMSGRKRDAPIDIYINGSLKIVGLLKEDAGRRTVHVIETCPAPVNETLENLKKQAMALKGGI